MGIQGAKSSEVFSLFGGAILFVFLGMLPAVYHLASQPIEAHRDSGAPSSEESKAYKLNLERGRMQASPDYRLRIARILEAAPGEHTLQEGDINQWLRENFRVPGQSATGQEATVTPSVPDLRFSEDGTVQIASNVSLKLPGLDKSVVFFVRGHLKSGKNGGLRFVADMARIGRSPLPFLEGFLAHRLMSIFLAAEGAPDLGKIWERAELLDIGDGYLRLRISE